MRKDESTMTVSANGHKKAILYARVSGDDRGKEGRNLKGQTEMGREHCQKRGYQIVAELSEDDRGASGAEIDLPQLSKAIEMARAGQYDVFVVREIDRLSRNLAKQLIVEEELRRAGVTIEYVLGEYPDTPEGSLMKNVKASVAEYERLKIVERSRRGKYLKAQSNKLVLPAWPPYGFMRRDGQLVPNPAESSIVLTVFGWYAFGEDDSGPMSLVGIARRLHAQGVPIPKPGRVTVRGYWHPVTVDRILRNELYVGRAYFGKTQRVNGKQVPQPPEKWILVDAPTLAIVDPATWTAAQERRERNKLLSRRNRKHDYLLAGHFRCAACGSAMTGHTVKLHTGKEWLTYRCSTSLRYHSPCPCYNRKVSAQKIDTKVWDWLVGLFDTSDDECTENIKKQVEAMNQRRESALEPMRQRLDVVGDLIAKATRRVGRLAATIAELEGEQTAEENDQAVAALKAQLRTASGEAARLKRERNSLTAQVAKMPQPEPYMRFIKDVWTLLHSLKNPTFEEKRRWLDRLNVRVAFRHDPETGRWLDASCEVGAKSLPLDKAGDANAECRSMTRA